MGQRIGSIHWNDIQGPKNRPALNRMADDLAAEQLGRPGIR